MGGNFAAGSDASGVVDDLDIVWSSLPLETDSQLVVDPDAVLTGAVARESFQPVTAKRRQVCQRLGAIQPDLRKHDGYDQQCAIEG
jgi:hypothetical protein